MYKLKELPPAPTHLKLPLPYRHGYDNAKAFINANPHTAINLAPDHWPEPETDLRHTIHQPTWRMCGHPTRYNGKPDRCRNSQGLGTNHPGVAYCKPHGGTRLTGRATGAWIMGHAFATYTGQTTPWDALQTATNIAHNKVLAIQQELATHLDNLTLTELTTNGYKEDLHPLLTLDGIWFDRLTRVAKWSIDAGLGERLVAQLETDAGALAQATRRAVETLNLDPAQEEELLALIGQNLRQLDAGNIIEGQTT